MGRPEPEVAGDAVVDVNDVVAYLEVAKVGDEGLCPTALRLAAPFRLAEEIAFGQHDQSRLREFVPRTQGAGADQQPAALSARLLQIRSDQIVLVEDLP